MNDLFTTKNESDLAKVVFKVNLLELASDVLKNGGVNDSSQFIESSEAFIQYAVSLVAATSETRYEEIDQIIARQRGCSDRLSLS